MRSIEPLIVPVWISMRPTEMRSSRRPSSVPGSKVAGTSGNASVARKRKPPVVPASQAPRPSNALNSPARMIGFA
jgi:hypothetical protein